MQRSLTPFGMFFAATLCYATETVTLDDARVAQQQVASALTSGLATGTFRGGTEDANGESVVSMSGSFELAFAEEKLWLELSFDTRLRKRRNQTRVDEAPEQVVFVDAAPVRVVIVDDGSVVTSVTYSPRLEKTGCRVELYQNVADAMLREIGVIWLDPAHPQLGILDIGRTIDIYGPEAITWSDVQNSRFRGRFTPKVHNRPDAISRGHVTFDVDVGSGSQLTVMRGFNAGSDVPALSRSLRWKQTAGVWHVENLIERGTARSKSGQIERRFREVTYDTFETNVAIPDNRFLTSSLSIPQGTRTHDRRRS